MILIIKPILMAFLKSDSVKRLVLDLLRAYAKTTDNTIDDQVCDYVEKNLIGPRVEQGSYQCVLQLVGSSQAPLSCFCYTAAF